MHCRVIYTSIFFLIFTCKILAQFKSLDLDLSSENITDFVWQKNGLGWVATDEGLNVLYDNEQLVFYASIEDSLSLLNSNIKKLFKSSGEKLVALSQDGISVFNEKNLSFNRIYTSSEPVFVFENDLNGTFWIATKNSGYYHLNQDLSLIANYSFDPLNPLSISTSNLGEQSETSILTIDDKFTYISTTNGFNVFNNKQGTFKRYYQGKKTSLTSNKILGIQAVNEGIIIISPNELVLYDTDKKTFSLLFSPSSEILNFNKLDNNNLLLRTNEKNVVVSLIDKKIVVDQQIGLDALAQKNILTIENGFIFWEKGDLNLRKVNFQLSDIETFNLNIPINSVKIVKDKVHIATVNGLKILDFSKQIVNDIASSSESDFLYVHEGSIVNFNENEIHISTSLSEANPLILKNNNIDFNRYVFETQGSLVVLGNKDIRLFDISKGEFIKSSIDGNALKNITIKNLKLIENTLYVGHDNGIIEVDFEKLLKNEIELNFFDYNELLNKNIPRGFYDIEKIGASLFVTQPLSGLSVYEGDFNKLINRFTYDGDAKTSLAASTPTKLFYIEKENNLYIASLGNGLFQYNLENQEFTNFNTNDGLLSNNIYDFLNYDDRLYFQSGTGINYFDEGRIKNINQYDGLDIESFHKESLHVFEDNIIVSGKNAQEVFAVTDVNKKNNDFKIGLFKTIGIDEFNNTKIVPLEDNIIQVDYKTKTIILDIVPSEQYKAEQIQYFIEKEGGDIIRNGFNNQIQLNALPYYSSSISLYAINGDGQRSGNNLVLEIYNAPPWWLRVETIFGYVILLIVSIRSFVQYREKKTKERMEGERKDKELEEAKQLQNSLLPKHNPAVNGFDISTYLKPATEIGGDYYDFFYKKDEYFYAICGDATGHGVVSGIMVSVTKAGLNGIPMGEPSTILQQLNRIVKRVNFGRLRMSLSVAQFIENKFKLSSAAMPPTYYFSARDNDIEEILVPNLPLGGIETEKFDGVEKDFHPGDVMVMISDGLPELPNKRNDLLDYPLVFNCIKDNAKKSADEIKDALVELSDEWAEGLMNPDDITIVVIKKAA